MAFGKLGHIFLHGVHDALFHLESLLEETFTDTPVNSYTEAQFRLPASLVCVLKWMECFLSDLVWTIGAFGDCRGGPND